MDVEKVGYLHFITIHLKKFHYLHVILEPLIFRTYFVKIAIQLLFV